MDSRVCWTILPAIELRVTLDRRMRGLRITKPDQVVSTDPPTTTTSVMLTFRTSSMSGCAVHCESVFPDLFATLAVPKAEELVATPIVTAARRRPKRSFSTA